MKTIAENTRNFAGGTAPQYSFFEILENAKNPLDKISEEEKAKTIINNVKKGLAALGGE